MAFWGVFETTKTLKRGPINYQLPSVVFELRQVSTIVTITSLKRTRAVAGAVARH